MLKFISCNKLFFIYTTAFYNLKGMDSNTIFYLLRNYQSPDNLIGVVQLLDMYQSAKQVPVSMKFRKAVNIYNKLCVIRLLKMQNKSLEMAERLAQVAAKAVMVPGSLDSNSILEISFFFINLIWEWRGCNRYPFLYFSFILMPLKKTTYRISQSLNLLFLLPSFYT